ncbi:MAG: CPBP family intramembrane metalloprotease [Oscillospiraceae bacterium]|nr:CPBP family intramembrane metalloprotease [Oscillospiraceae bacterium]
MSMLLYYFVHSTWNQLRKLIRTWAFIMLIVFVLIGGLVAFAVRWYYQRLSAVEGLLPESFMEFFEVEGMSGLNAVELAVGLLVLGILVIQTIGAEKSVSRLFLQADVNLLFASPLSSQTVLLFRLMTTLGMAFATQLLLFFQIPAFMKRFQLSFFAALSIPLAWCLTMGFSVLLKALIYEIGSRHPFFRRNLRWFILAFLGILGLTFYRAYRHSEEQVLLLSAHRFLNGGFSRWIPVWGWVKGFPVSAMEGNIPQALCFLGLSLGLIAALILLVRRLPADYYEDTLSRTQEIALLIESFRQDGIRSVADAFSRTEHIRRREGFHYGRGSGVYFFKVLYNRFRSSRFLTRTGVTYLIAALGAGWFDRKFMDTPVIYIPVLVLAAMVFFRSILSPVTEDIRKASFLLQPDPIWSKLFSSALGGSCNCALDAALPLMLGSWAAGFPPLKGLLFLPALAAVDFFASAAGAFVEVSLPQSIGSTFRQVIQILLLYVGLIFDGMLLTSGITGGYLAAGFVLVTLVNLVFGSFFLGLTGVWLYPCSGRPVKIPSDSRTDAAAGKAYAAVGLALTGMYLALHISRLLFSGWRLPPLLSVYAPVYAIGFPVFLLILRPRGSTLRAERRTASPLRPGEFLLLIPVCFFVMYGGNIAGSLLAGLLHTLRPFPLLLPSAAPTAENPVLQAVFPVLVSPLMEEFVFRRCVIERVLPYGSRTAVWVSALLFGLFHGTVNQLCYAFLLGLVFGHVYVRTRRLRYTVCLHVLINALSSLVLPLLLVRISGSASFQAMSRSPVTQVLSEPGVLPLLIYLAFLFVCSLLGAVLFLFGLRERPLPRDGVSLKTACSSWGMLTFVGLACVGLYASL